MRRPQAPTVPGRLALRPSASYQLWSASVSEPKMLPVPRERIHGRWETLASLSPWESDATALDCPWIRYASPQRTSALVPTGKVSPSLTSSSSNRQEASSARMDDDPDQGRLHAPFQLASGGENP